MYLSPLSPVLNKMLCTQDTSSISYLHTTEASALKKFFLNKVAKTLLEKKKMLIVIPDGMAATTPVKLLATYNLAHYSLHLSDNEPISKLQMERLKKLGHLNELNLEAGSFRSTEQKVSELKTHVTQALDSINKPTAKGPSLKSMILDEVDKPQSYISPDIKRLLSQVAIDHDTLSLVHRMQQGHQRHYDFSDASSNLTTQTFEDHDHIAQAQDEISTLNTALNEVIIKIENNLEKTREQFQEEIDKEFSKWLSIKEEFELAAFEQEVGESQISFDECFESLMSDTSHMQFLKLYYKRQPSLNWGEAPLVIEVIQNLLDNVNVTIESIYQRFLNRLTPFNIESTELNDQIERAQSILRAINNCQFLNIKTAKRYLQIAELIFKLKDVANNLHLAETALMDAGYCHYRELAVRANLPTEVRQALTHIKSDNWRDVIMYHASHLQIQTLFNNDLNRLEELHSSYRKSASQLRKISLQEIHNRWCNLRSQNIAHLKNEHWDTYQSIWINGDCKLNSQEVYQQLGQRLQSFCPIMVVHESDLSTTWDIGETAYDEILFLESKALPIKLLKRVNQEDNHITILSSYDLKSDQISIPIKRYYSTAMNIPVQSLANCTNSTDQYHQAQSIAGHLVDLANNSTIFKWKDQIVISLVNPKLNDKILAHLEIEPKHFIYRSTLEIGHFVEALMTEKRIVILGENQLINDELTDDILWQQHLLSELKKIDIHMLSMATVDLYYDKEKALNELKRQLNQRVQEEAIVPVPSSAPQLALSV